MASNRIQILDEKISAQSRRTAGDDIAHIGGSRLKVRIARTAEDMASASRLIAARYEWRGYGTSHAVGLHEHKTTFLLESDDMVVGTITLAIDGPGGLAVAKTFDEEVKVYRSQPSRRICELTKFAFAPDVQSKEAMAALFHIVFIYGQRMYDCTDLFIEVHPRHVRFYESMLCFERVGATRINENVGVHSQLLVLEVADIRRNIDLSAARSQAAKARSLYPLFFSAETERTILGRLPQVHPYPSGRHDGQREVHHPWPADADGHRIGTRHGEAVPAQLFG